MAGPALCAWGIDADGKAGDGRFGVDRGLAAAWMISSTGVKAPLIVVSGGDDWLTAAVEQVFSRPLRQ